MRYVPINCVKEGMILGKSLYGRKGELQLAEGVELHHNYIQRIKELGYQGIYIIDEISKDIEVANVISETLKMQTIFTIKTLFTVSRKNDKDNFDNILEQTKRQVDDIIDEILNNKHTLVNIIDLKVFDDYTYYHSVNVAVLSIIIGVRLKLTRDKLYELGMSAILHDIGKVFIAKELLNKKEKLTEEELNTIREHPKLGYNYLKEKYSLPFSVYQAIYQHHEKYNGKGYPLGLRGKKINLYGKIIAIADVYDALTSDRSYRKAISPSDAYEYIMGQAGISFDVDLVTIFTRSIAAYPVGTFVKLSNGLIGLVVKNNSDFILRPKVKIINSDGSYYYINLRDERYDVTILGIVEM